MIKHLQKDFGQETGDCFAACLASLLEVPLESVPNFRKQQTEAKDGSVCMVTEADKWLRSVHNKRIITIELYSSEGGKPKTDQVLLNRLCQPGEMVILSGESPRTRSDGGKKYHCVIGRPQVYGYEVVHDPHPDGTGIVGQPYGVKWIVPTEGPTLLPVEDSR